MHGFASLSLNVVLLSGTAFLLVTLAPLHVIMHLLSMVLLGRISSFWILPCFCIRWWSSMWGVNTRGEVPVSYQRSSWWVAGALSLVTFILITWVIWCGVSQVFLLPWCYINYTRFCIFTSNYVKFISDNSCSSYLFYYLILLSSAIILLLKAF